MMSVERISLEQFDGMAEEWEALHEQSAQPSFFQNWQWLHAWWKTFQRNRSLFVLTFREGRDLIGAAPLFLDKRVHWTGMHFKELRFLGTEKVSSDYLDFLYLPGRERAVANEFLNYLDAHPESWDVLQLSDCADDSRLIGIMQAEAAARNYAILSRRKTEICPYLRLPKSVASFHDGLNKNIRRQIRQLNEQGFRLEVVASNQNYCDAFEETVRLHTQRWQADSLSGNMANPRVLDFHRMILASNAKQWQPRFFLLLNSEKIIAALYAFVYRDKLIYYQGGYNPAYAKYSPGTSLIAMAIEYAIGQSLSEFDYLRGDEAYKWKWTQEFRRTFTYAIFQRRAKSGVHLLLDQTVQELKRSFKKNRALAPASNAGTEKSETRRDFKAPSRKTSVPKPQLEISPAA